MQYLYQLKVEDPKKSDSWRLIVMDEDGNIAWDVEAKWLIVRQHRFDFMQKEIEELKGEITGIKKNKCGDEMRDELSSHANMLENEVDQLSQIVAQQTTEILSLRKMLILNGVGPGKL